MIRIASLFAVLLLVSASGAAIGEPPQQTIPRVGLAGDDLDACLSIGQVTGLNPRGDNFLAVRFMPTTKARVNDRLGPGRQMWICEESGEWLGVVYDRFAHDGPGECGVASPVSRARPYDGMCRWGWVSSRYVTVIAG